MTGISFCFGQGQLIRTMDFTTRNILQQQKCSNHPLWKSRFIEMDIITSKTWSITQCACGGWMTYYSNFYKFTTDSLIGSTVYKKLSLIDTINNHTFAIGLFREDIALKKVYWRVGSQDQLLYDFNLNVG